MQPVPAPVPFITHWMDCTVPLETAERMSDSVTPRQWQIIFSVDGDIADLRSKFACCSSLFQQEQAFSFQINTTICPLIEIESQFPFIVIGFRRSSTFFFSPFSYQDEFHRMESVPDLVGFVHDRRQFLQEGNLGRVDFPLGSLDGKEFRFVHFGEFRWAARFGRPFHLESVADKGRRVVVALERPGVDDFAALLLDGGQGAKGASRDESGFFRKFPWAAPSRSSSGSGSPLGMDQMPSSLLRKKGPPGWASSTCNSPPALRYISNPALSLGMVFDPFEFGELIASLPHRAGGP